MAPSKLPRWLVEILESDSAFKAVGITYFLILLVATFGVFKLIEDDPQTFRDFGVFIAVVCAVVSMWLAQLTLRKLGAEHKVVEGDGRMKLYLYGGFGAALVLALLLSIYNHIGTVNARDHEEASRAEREAAGRSERDPSIQKALEIMKQRRESKTTQAATQPAQK